MDGQLRLTPTEPAEDDTPPVLLDLDVPEHLVKLVGRMEPSASDELRRRLAVALGQTFRSIAEIRSLTSDELRAALSVARADVDRYTAELDRRATAAFTCTVCGGRDEHTPDCELAR